MVYEQPVNVKRRRVSKVEVGSDSKSCIVHYDRNVSDTHLRSLSEHSFRTIQQAATVRQSQSVESQHMDSICQKIPAQFDSEVHGVHRWCYRNFTNVSKFSTQTGTHIHREDEDTPELQGFRKSARSANADGECAVVLFPKNQCLFCNKDRKKVKGTHETLVTCVTETGEQSIKDAAKEKFDFSMLGRIEDMDLRAREARYHESCRRSYVRAEFRHHSTSGTVGDVHTNNTEQQEQRQAHRNAFQHLCSHIQQSIIDDGNVERMTMLKERYMEFIQEHTPEYYNDEYRTSKLKERLQKHFRQQIKFWLPSRRYTSELLYAADLDTGEAVETAYEATSSETTVLAEAAPY